MHTLKMSSKIIVFSALSIIGVGIFFMGKYIPTLGNVDMIKSFVTEMPDVPPNYVGQILSKDGNLLTIEYFETEAVDVIQFESKREFLKFLHQASLREKLKVKAQLQQKIAGKVTILVPLSTPVYKTKEVPVLSSLSELERGNLVIIWGNSNDKQQVISNFIITANENKNDIK